MSRLKDRIAALSNTIMVSVMQLLRESSFEELADAIGQGKGPAASVSTTATTRRASPRVRNPSDRAAKAAAAPEKPAKRPKASTDRSRSAHVGRPARKAATDERKRARTSSEDIAAFRVKTLAALDEMTAKTGAWVAVSEVAKKVDAPVDLVSRILAKAKNTKDVRSKGEKRMTRYQSKKAAAKSVPSKPAAAADRPAKRGDAQETPAADTTAAPAPPAATDESPVSLNGKAEETVPVSAAATA